MLRDIGKDVGDLSWVGPAETTLAAQLADGSVLGAVASVDGAVVSGALARTYPSLPGPDGDGSRAWMFSVATFEQHRRRGHARAVIQHLLDRLDSLRVTRVDLTASRDGDQLYRSFGFADAGYPMLSRRASGSSTGRPSL